jgi:hypothetical protein
MAILFADYSVDNKILALFRYDDDSDPTAEIHERLDFLYNRF